MNGKDIGNGLYIAGIILVIVGIFTNHLIGTLGIIIGGAAYLIKGIVKNKENPKKAKDKPESDMYSEKEP